jgi:carboxylesterase type B
LFALVRAIGDHDAVCSTYDAARRAAAAGADVYLYNFARPDADPIYAPFGADHQAEIGYVFGSIDLPTEDDQVARAMQGYWTRLASKRRPERGGRRGVARYDEVADQRINFDVPVSVVSGFRRTQCEFWLGVYDEEFQ